MLSCLPTCAHVIMVLCHVRLHFGTNPSPQSASELAVAISIAKYGSEMSLPVSNVERCSLRAPPLLELTRPAFPGGGALRSIRPVQWWDHSLSCVPRFVSAGPSRRGRIQVVARASHCTGGCRCACARRHHHGGDHPTKKATSPPYSPR
jgi:hypothetical protein